MEENQIIESILKNPSIHQLQSIFDGRFILTEPGRFLLLKEGAKIDGKPVYLFLFNDILIISSPSSYNPNRLSVELKIDLKNSYMISENTNEIFICLIFSDFEKIIYFDILSKLLTFKRYLEFQQKINAEPSKYSFLSTYNPNKPTQSSLNTPENYNSQGFDNTQKSQAADDSLLGDFKKNSNLNSNLNSYNSYSSYQTQNLPDLNTTVEGLHNISNKNDHHPNYGKGVNLQNNPNYKNQNPYMNQKSLDHDKIRRGFGLGIDSNDTKTKTPMQRVNHYAAVNINVNEVKIGGNWTFDCPRCDEKILYGELKLNSKVICECGFEYL